jgi:proline dehydrogenase
MLLGVRSEDAQALVRRGVPVRLYVPYGKDWFRYWMRRIAEAQGGG